MLGSVDSIRRFVNDQLDAAAALDFFQTEWLMH